MEKEYIYLLELLSAFIHRAIPSKREDIDWKRLILLSEIHSVDGILGYMAKQYSLSPTPEIEQVMRGKCMRTVAVFASRNASMENLVRQMNEAGIDHLLFKGYVVKDYYPIPELRSYGDIDFVIREKDREKSHQFMLDRDYHIKTDWEPVFSYYKQMEYYEIHTDVMEVDVSDKGDYRGYFKDMWNHVTQVDEHTWEFTPEYHFIYMLTHIAKHIYGSGAGIRMYLDLAVFVLHFEDKVGWEYIKNELNKIGLFDFYTVVMNAVEKWFGVVSPIETDAVSEEVLDEFTVYTLEAGVYGHFQRESGVTTLKRSECEEKPLSRFSVLRQRLFPAASDIEKRYTYLRNRHWLLPVAWVHRFFKTQETWRNHIHEAQVIMSAETEEVERLKKIYKDIGL